MEQRLLTAEKIDDGDWAGDGHLHSEEPSGEGKGLWGSMFSLFGADEEDAEWEERKREQELAIQARVFAEEAMLDAERERYAYVLADDEHANEVVKFEL